MPSDTLSLPDVFFCVRTLELALCVLHACCYGVVLLCTHLQDILVVFTQLDLAVEFATFPPHKRCISTRSVLCWSCPGFAVETFFKR